MRLAVIFICCFAGCCLAVTDSMAQSDTAVTKAQTGVRFKAENISFNASLLITQQERVYYSHRFDPSIGRPSFPGFVRQPVGFGYDLSLNYSLVRKRGFLLDVGLGVWSYSLNYKAIEDSIDFIKPNSEIRSYFRNYTVFSMPVSFSYQIRQGLVFGFKTALPIVSESKITSPDTTLRYNGNVNSFDWSYLFIEGRIGYEFHIKSLTLTPMISFGGMLYPIERARYLYKVGLAIQYGTNEK
ncbi:MAG: hypothetical protein H6601_02200 [Flavobacteriales bacterium]|nr:hypothetical protein [Flavobacteriales bacterium]